MGLGVGLKLYSFVAYFSHDIIALMVLLLLILSLLYAVFFLLAFVSQQAGNVVYKFHMARLGLSHLAFSKDKSWTKQEDPALAKPTGRKKKIIFIRHAESAWNEVFNQWGGGGWKTFPLRLAKAVKNELELLPTLDSVFLDSPLSQLGTTQALDLQANIRKMEGVNGDILNGRITSDNNSKPKSVICSSNLRRAVSTATISLYDRLSQNQEKIYILSSLQEVTKNLDGIAMAKPKTSPLFSITELRALNKSDFNPAKIFDCSYNNGDKPVKSRGIERLISFSQWAFSREEEIVIAFGHSFYFRFFFQTFLPSASSHLSKTEKMHNCSIVSFDLLEMTTPSKRTTYMIDDTSIQSLYLGFESSKKKH